MACRMAERSRTPPLQIVVNADERDTLARSRPENLGNTFNALEPRRVRVRTRRLCSGRIADAGLSGYRPRRGTYGAWARDGAIVRTATGIKAHPAIREELSCRGFIVRTLQKLGLNYEPLRAAPGRPPNTGDFA